MKMRSRGLTVIEILIAACIATVLFAALWGAVRYSGRSTGAAMVQADCIRRAGLLVGRLQREIDRGETLLHPAPGATVDTLVLRLWNGRYRLVYAAPSRRHVIASDVGGEEVEGRSALVVEFDDTKAYLDRLEFQNVAGSELIVTCRFHDGQGKPLAGCDGLTASFPIARKAVK